MHHFAYRGGVLCAENVPIPDIAADVGTPFYCYSTATLERHYKVFTDGLFGLDPTVCFAVKANANLAVIRTLAKMGAGCDVVSGGELRLALKAGVPASRIVFSGVGKTAEELAFAIGVGIGQVNVESEPELDLLNGLAVAKGARVRVALRVNPDVDSGGHDKITTGRKEDKFGIEWTLAPKLYRKARTMSGIDASAVAVHIGSQITDLAPFETAFQRVRDLVLLLRADGIDIRHLDLGGGLGVPYEHASNNLPPSPAAYGDMVRRTVGGLGCKLAFEPGRVIVGNAGILVTRVTFIKEGTTRRFTVVDAGMNDLIRPAMYGAVHEIIPVREHTVGGSQPTDVVGPVCESSDRFVQGVTLPPLKSGDLVALLTAGAYGASMSSTYNARPLIPEVLVDGDRFAVVRRRPTFEEMISLEQLPAWLE